MKNYTEIIKNAREVNLNDLPKYSPWPERILGLSEWKREERTSEDIEREYEKETYLPFVKMLSENTNIKTSHDLCAEFYKGRENGNICVIEDRFKQLSWEEAFLVENAIIANCLKQHLPAPAIVDLGAGPGSTVLALASMPEFANIQMYALEKMQSARKVIKILAERNNINLNVGECDLSSDRLTTENIPEGSILFINIVISVITRSTQKIIETILQYKPKIVFHFEPFYGCNDLKTLYGQFCAKYMEINKYNMIFDSELKELDGKILDIVYEKKNYFGNNPFFPKSIIAWKPRNN